MAAKNSRAEGFARPRGNKMEKRSCQMSLQSLNFFTPAKVHKGKDCPWTQKKNEDKGLVWPETRISKLWLSISNQHIQWFLRGHFGKMFKRHSQKSKKHWITRPLMRIHPRIIYMLNHLHQTPFCRQLSPPNQRHYQSPEPLDSAWLSKQIATTKLVFPFLPQKKNIHLPSNNKLMI